MLGLDIATKLRRLHRRKVSVKSQAFYVKGKQEDAEIKMNDMFDNSFPFRRKPYFALICWIYLKDLYYCSIVRLMKVRLREIIYIDRKAFLSDKTILTLTDRPT